jgi:hypothetical protein
MADEELFKMLPIRFDDITADDIVRLITDKTSERKTIEYKQALNIGNTDDKAEFLADISSFANASGGDIVFGISEERDASRKPTGIPGSIVPLVLDNPATVCGSIENLIRDGIQPRIPVVYVKHFDIPGEGSVIVVRVGKSWIAPHMVSYANRTRFFSRNSSTGKVQLDVQQIGAAFALQRGLGERLRSWKTDRISKAVAGEGPVLLTGASFLFHFISVAALTDDGPALPRLFEPERWRDAHSHISFNAAQNRYNADGFLSVWTTGLSQGQFYLQVFREGSLEYGDSYALSSKGGGVIASVSFEDKLKSIFKAALSLLSQMEVADPIFVSLTLIGVKGMTLSMSPDVSEPFDRDVIVCPDIQIQNLDEGFPYPSTLLPIVDSVWQAAGRGRSPFTALTWKTV